jgi:hypothetical protein
MTLGKEITAIGKAGAFDKELAKAVNGAYYQ